MSKLEENNNDDDMFEFVEDDDTNPPKDDNTPKTDVNIQETNLNNKVDPSPVIINDVQNNKHEEFKFNEVEEYNKEVNKAHTNDDKEAKEHIVEKIEIKAEEKLTSDKKEHTDEEVFEFNEETEVKEVVVEVVSKPIEVPIIPNTKKEEEVFEFNEVEEDNNSNNVAVETNPQEDNNKDKEFKRENEKVNDLVKQLSNDDNQKNNIVKSQQVEFNEDHEDIHHSKYTSDDEVIYYKEDVCDADDKYKESGIENTEKKVENNIEVPAVNLNTDNVIEKIHNEVIHNEIIHKDGVINKEESLDDKEATDIILEDIEVKSEKVEQISDKVFDEVKELNEVILDNKSKKSNDNEFEFAEENEPEKPEKAHENESAKVYENQQEENKEENSEKEPELKLVTENITEEKNVVTEKQVEIHIAHSDNSEEKDEFDFVDEGEEENSANNNKKIENQSHKGIKDIKEVEEKIEEANKVAKNLNINVELTENKENDDDMFEFQEEDEHEPNQTSKTNNDDKKENKVEQKIDEKAEVKAEDDEVFEFNEVEEDNQPPKQNDQHHENKLPDQNENNNSNRNKEKENEDNNDEDFDFVEETEDNQAQEITTKEIETLKPESPSKTQQPTQQSPSQQQTHENKIDTQGIYKQFFDNYKTKFINNNYLSNKEVLNNNSNDETEDENDLKPSESLTLTQEKPQSTNFEYQYDFDKTSFSFKKVIENIVFNKPIINVEFQNFESSQFIKLVKSLENKANLIAPTKFISILSDISNTNIKKLFFRYIDLKNQYHGMTRKNLNRAESDSNFSKKSQTSIDNMNNLYTENDFDAGADIIKTQTNIKKDEEENDEFDFAEEEAVEQNTNSNSNTKTNNEYFKQTTLTSNNEEKVDKSREPKSIHDEKDNFKNLKLKTDDMNLMHKSGDNNGSSKKNKVEDAKTKEINNILSSLMSDDTSAFTTKNHNESTSKLEDDDKKDKNILDENVIKEIDEVQMMQMLKTYYGDKIDQKTNEESAENAQKKKEEEEYNKMLSNLPNYNFLTSKYVEYPDSFFN